MQACQGKSSPALAAELLAVQRHLYDKGRLVNGTWKDNVQDIPEKRTEFFN